MPKPTGKPTGRPRNPEVDRLAALLGLELKHASYLGAKRLQWMLGKEERAKRLAEARASARKLQAEELRLIQEYQRAEARKLYLVAAQRKRSTRIERMVELAFKKRMA